MYTEFGSGDGSDDGSPTGTTDNEFGEINEIVVAGNPLAVAGIDGVKLATGYGMVDKTLANTEDVEQGTAAVLLVRSIKCGSTKICYLLR